MKGTSSSVGAICRLTVSIIALVALSACGGSSNKKFTIGGTVSGLTGTVVLSNNGGDNLSRSSNGSFTFSSKVKKRKNVRRCGGNSAGWPDLRSCEWLRHRERRCHQRGGHLYD